jgi:hypothetical protein
VTIPTSLVRADESAWDAWLSGVPKDVFHGAGFHRYAQDAGQGEPFLAVVGDRDRGIAWPYLLRQLDDVAELAGSGATDIHSVYAYPGPVAWGCRPGDAFVAGAWAELQAIWREQGAVSIFTRFHPLLGNVALVADLPWRAHGDGRKDAGQIVAGGTTVSVDLTLDAEAIRAGYGRGLRREINAARQKGLISGPDESWSALPEFAEMYRRTMVRAGAAAFYFFDLDDFRRLRDRLDGQIHLIVARVDDRIAGAGLFTECDGIAQWYLAGTNDEFRSLSPSKVILEDAFAWARARGARVMHLGGGLGSQEDALFWFKSRFSPQRHTFHTGRWVLDPDRYRDLVQARRAAAPAGAELDPGFFPAYRALFRDPEPATG